MAVALCLLPAAGFGAMAIVGNPAYDAGIGTLTLLIVRFALAAAIFAPVIAVRPALRPIGAGRRALAVGLGLGAVGYATQAGLFFAGMAQVGPSTASILSTFEPVVTATLAFLAFEKRLSLAQVAGACLVIAAAVVLATPARPCDPVPSV